MLVPVQPAVVEVLLLPGFLYHASGEGTENPLHHGQVLPVIVGLKHSDAHVILEHYAPDRPHVARLTPTQLCTKRFQEI